MRATAANVAITQTMGPPPRTTTDALCENQLRVKLRALVITVTITVTLKVLQLNLHCIRPWPRSS